MGNNLRALHNHIKPTILSFPRRPESSIINSFLDSGLRGNDEYRGCAKVSEDIAVDGSFIQQELGFVPQYDLKTGWEETIRERDSFK